jgi:hypothetical protein
VKQLQDIIHELKSPGGLSFRPLDLSELRVVCYADAGFASHADDFRSQIGYIVALLDKRNNANVLAFASRKCRRETQSVLASELLALVAGYDVAASIAAQVSEILGV